MKLIFFKNKFTDFFKRCLNNVIYDNLSNLKNFTEKEESIYSYEMRWVLLLLLYIVEKRKFSDSSENQDTSAFLGEMGLWSLPA